MIVISFPENILFVADQTATQRERLIGNLKGGDTGLMEALVDISTAGKKEGQHLHTWP